jgi:hypothetical protein
MRRLQESWGFEQIIDYNLRDGGTAVTIFAEAQTDRVERAKRYIDSILDGYTAPAIIVEPGCSAGDISGPYAEKNFVYGCDVVPAAVAATRARYPRMNVEQSTAEAWPPRPCDILVLCEFLEHIVDPVDFVRAWLPLAKHVVIGHPLVGGGWDPEVGHLWAYDEDDFRAWFPLGGHVLDDWQTFPMGPYQMVMGRGRRLTAEEEAFNEGVFV